MIKTIDTRNITDIMLEAQSVIDGTTTYSDPLSFKDAADIFIAMAEAAPAVEPAQAVPAFWANENILKDSLRDNISCILTTTKCAANTVPLYTTPPAIVEAAQAVPIYQVALEWGVGWIDVSEDLYKKCEGIKRIIYIDHAPLESKQAVPVGYVSGWINGHLALRLLDPALALSTGTALFLQLHTAPPAIEDETRKMVLELCKVVDNYTDIPLTKQIREKLEAGNEN